MRLLIVEDDLTVRRTIGRLVGDCCHEPTFASSLDQARALIASADEIEMAIVDVWLPDGSGLELVEELRNRWSDVAVLVLTGDASPSTIARAQELGTQYLLKPPKSENIQAFVLCSPSPAVLASLRRFAEKYELSHRETELLSYACAGFKGAKLARLMDCSNETVRSFRDRIRRKCDDAPNLDAVVLRVKDDARKWLAAAAASP